MSSSLVLLELMRLQHGKVPTGLAASYMIGFGLGAFVVVYTTLKTSKSDDIVCTTKSGTYKIRAPRSRLTKKEQLDLCKNYVESYEKTQNSWLRPYLNKLCGVNPDDILKNVHG